MKKKNDNVYIIFDGTSHFGVFECDIDDYKNDEEYEIIEGPFIDWNDEVDRKIENLNDEM